MSHATWFKLNQRQQFFFCSFLLILCHQTIQMNENVPLLLIPFSSGRSDMNFNIAQIFRDSFWWFCVGDFGNYLKKDMNESRIRNSRFTALYLEKNLILQEVHTDWRSEDAFDLLFTYAVCNAIFEKFVKRSLNLRQANSIDRIERWVLSAECFSIPCSELKCVIKLKTLFDENRQYFRWNPAENTPQKRYTSFSIVNGKIIIFRQYFRWKSEEKSHYKNAIIFQKFIRIYDHKNEQIKLIFKQRNQQYH